MTDLNNKFFNSYLEAYSHRTVYTDKVPKEMMASAVDKEGWFEWKLINGTLRDPDYKQVEEQFKVKFPKSFINWHKKYFFFDGGCSLLNLPESIPTQPLEEIKRNLDWYIPQQLIPKKLYPFGSEGNDTGPLVFDGRNEIVDNEYPIRVYDHEFFGDLEGLSEIIFSSFTKLLECLTHFLTELKTKQNFEIIPDFFQIDPSGAGKTGIDYWLSWVAMQKANYDEFG